MSTRTIAAKSLARFAAALAGLLALWLGCDLTNAPLHMRGPINLSFNLPVGAPLVAFGVVGVAFVPDRAWVLAWPLAGLLTLATAGMNLWQGIPVEDGGFQAMRAGVPDPDTWPAPAVLHAVAFAPAEVARGAAAAGSGHRRVARRARGRGAGLVGMGMVAASARQGTRFSPALVASFHRVSRVLPLLVATQVTGLASAVLGVSVFEASVPGSRRRRRACLPC